MVRTHPLSACSPPSVFHLFTRVCSQASGLLGLFQCSSNAEAINTFTALIVRGSWHDKVLLFCRCQYSMFYQALCLTGFDCRVIEQWINNLFLEVCRWVCLCVCAHSAYLDVVWHPVVTQGSLVSVLLPAQVELIVHVCDTALHVPLMHDVFLVCSFRKLFLLHRCHMNPSSRLSLLFLLQDPIICHLCLLITWGVYVHARVWLSAD